MGVTKVWSLVVFCGFIVWGFTVIVSHTEKYFKMGGGGGVVRVLTASLGKANIDLI